MVAVGTIRRCRPADRDWITEVAAEVYRDLGDYRAILPPWFDHPGVASWIEEAVVGDARVPRGFAMLGLHSGPRVPRPRTIEVVALAVAPRHQRRGVGRALLDHVIETAEQSAVGVAGSAFLMLTLAGDNAIARRLYESAGFYPVPGDHGRYDGGQPAIRMARPLRPRWPAQPEPT